MLLDIPCDFNLRGSKLVVLGASEMDIADAWDYTADYVSEAAGFLQAATPVVVAPLWSVHEISTALLMDWFCREMEHGLVPAEVR